VQTAALKIICDRENEIKAFDPVEYWTIGADFKKGRKFSAKLAEYKGKKVQIDNKDQNDQILSELTKGKFVVKSLEERDRSRKPFAPFTTSSLQQDAANKINFTAKKTMMVAQQLYEGVEIKGKGTVGLVSYIRTDSVRISDEAREHAKEFILSKLGEEYYSNNFYTSKKKDIQDAHEAIRPSDVSLEPDLIKASLTKDQYNLYKLIWNRFVASQMAPAKFKSVSAVIANGDYDFKATGSKMLFDGFLKVYSPSKDDDEKLLPELSVGEELVPISVNGEQNFTQPPARYSEAKRSAGIAASSSVKSSAVTSSIPKARIAAIRSSNDIRSFGALSGASTDNGCRLNVSAASAPARISRWPRWTPSKNPTARRRRAASRMTKNPSFRFQAVSRTVPPDRP
jgi:DNA topoisomerase-1